MLVNVSILTIIQVIDDIFDSDVGSSVGFTLLGPISLRDSSGLFTYSPIYAVPTVASVANTCAILNSVVRTLSFLSACSLTTLFTENVVSPVALNDVLTKPVKVTMAWR